MKRVLTVHNGKHNNIYGRGGQLIVPLSRDDAELLVALASFYEKAMGPMRYVIRLTAPADVRSKYMHVAQESQVLKMFAEATRERMASSGDTTREVSFTLPALVSFWGRLLASLNNRRSRRRLSPEEIARRESLSEKFQAALQIEWDNAPDKVHEELATRRPIEAEWMKSRLTLQS